MYTISFRDLSRNGINMYWIGMSVDEYGSPHWIDGSSVYYDEFPEGSTPASDTCIQEMF